MSHVNSAGLVTTLGLFAAAIAIFAVGETHRRRWSVKIDTVLEEQVRQQRDVHLVQSRAIQSSRSVVLLREGYELRSDGTLVLVPPWHIVVGSSSNDLIVRDNVFVK